MDSQIPSKLNIAKSFSRRAKRYCSAAFIQRSMIEKCVEYIKQNQVFESQSWLDAGCGAGLLKKILIEKSISGKLFQTDIAYDSVKCADLHGQSNHVSVQSDIESMPFKSSSFNGVVSTSVLHWMENPQLSVKEMIRVLKPKGILVFSVFLNGSFHEVNLLREKRNLPLPVRYFADDQMNNLAKNLQMDIVEYSIRNEVYYFKSAQEILRYLSDIGSTVYIGNRLTRKDLLLFCIEYENLFGTKQGIPLSCRYAWGKAVKRSEK